MAIYLIKLIDDNRTFMSATTMKLLVYLSCVLAVAELSAGGTRPHCNNTCDCKNRTCLGTGKPVCRLFKMGELAGEKHCDCKSYEADSSDDESDNDVGDRPSSTASSIEGMHVFHPELFIVIVFLHLGIKRS